MAHVFQSSLRQFRAGMITGLFLKQKFPRVEAMPDNERAKQFSTVAARNLD
jgi:hypothetical protein